MNHNKKTFSIFIFIIFLSLLSSNHAKYTILTTPIDLYYDQFNAIKQIKIRFMPQLDFKQNDILMLSFSEPLQTIPTFIQFSLVDQFKKQLANGMFNFITDPAITATNLHYFKNGASSSYTSDFSLSTWYSNSTEIPSQWLTLILNINQDLSNTFSTKLGSVNMAIFSSFDINNINYQSANGMSYFYFASMTPFAPLPLIAATISNPLYGKVGQTVSPTPGAIYPIYMELTPSINYTNFILHIQFTKMVLANLTGLISVPQTKDFQFQGSCYFICQSSILCITAEYCTVKSDRIEVKITQMIAFQKYVLRFNVLNPPYKADKNFLLWVDQIGSIQDMANIVTQVSTTPITISTDQLKLFWRVPQSTLTPMGLGIFIDGGISTVQIGFKIDNYSPFGQILQIDLDTGTSQLIMQSINHNLPSINTTISYKYTGRHLIIKNVTALTKVNTRYWISFRARYVTGDTLNSIGSLIITLRDKPAQLLFNPLPLNNIARVPTTYADYHDWAGFHTSFKNFDTQVISSIDNQLQNGTFQAIRKYFNQPTSVGIDPMTPNQELLFLLNVAQSKMYSGAANQRYQMKLFFNPNIFDSVSDKGLDVIAYNSTAMKWQTSANDCYFDQSLTPTTQLFMCQKYNDHVANYQQDNQLKTSPYFKYYHFICGDGTLVRCITPPCNTQCQLFKGYSLTQGGSGIAAIRNVTFKSGYQSPIQASDQNLDFIVCFYHNNLLVSASLINAYTVKFDSLKQTTVSLINTYHDGTNYNLGTRIPTLIKISGKLAFSEYLDLQYPDKMKIYFPSTVTKFDNFLVNINQIGCSYFCKFNKSLSNIVSQNWLQMNSLTVSNIPAMTNDFKIMIPIQLSGNLMSIYIGFQSKGKLIYIYRFGGSAILQSISSPLTYIFQTQTHTNLWNSNSDWTILPAYSYLQQINLEQTNSQNASTLITMSGSIMPAHTSPYVTFSSKYFEILGEFTNIIAGNSLANRTCDKINYNYDGIMIQTFICQLFTNDNTTNNNIKIQYPLFDNNFGPGFPYDQIFAFGYGSETTGQLQGYKLQRGDKVMVNLCKTNKQTQYNIGQIGRQLQIYRIQIDPILLSSSTFAKIQVQFTLPTNIQAVECSVKELIFNSTIMCAVLPLVLGVTPLELSINLGDSIKLIDFQIYLSVYQNVGLVLVPGQIFKVKIKLPHTTGVQMIFGSTFSPFFSIAEQCQNSFTYITNTYDSSIVLQSYKLKGVSLNLNSELTFNLTFSNQKSNLLSNSYVEFNFVNLGVTQFTLCYFESFEHKFFKRTFTATSYRIYANAEISGFTASKTRVKCSNLVLQSLTPTLSITVFDITANTMIMQSPAVHNLIAQTYFTSTTFSLSTAVITSKTYTTVGFNAQYQITYAVSGAGLTQGFIDLSDYAVDSRIVKCSLSIVQDVFCKVYELNTDSLLQTRSKFIYFKTYFPVGFASISLYIYPILQQKLITVPNIRTFIMTNGNNYYIPLVDSLPPIIVDDPILINSYNIIPLETASSIKFNLQITYVLSATISRPLYVQINEILFLTRTTGVILKCTINSIVVPCTAVQKDLIQVDIATFPHTINLQYKMTIQSFQANYQIPLYDSQNFFIKMFVIDTVTKQIDYISYINQQLTQSKALMTLIKSYQNYLGKSQLIWNLTDSFGITYLPKIYVGYFGKSIPLVQKNYNRFVQDFQISSPAYTLANFNCLMGYSKCEVLLTADTFTTVIKQYSFYHTSLNYWQPPLLQVQVSNQKCIIAAQFTNYKIFQNGLTLPIVLNFSNCRPRSLLTISTNLNSTQVFVDQSLSQLQVSFDNPIGIILVRHSSLITTLKSYLLSVSLIGTYSSSFTIPTSFMIDKITRVESSIQAKTPETLALTFDQIRLRIQCNQPSTVYWAQGFYPTTLGIKGEDIQTRLLDGQIGLKTSIIDSFNYGNLVYGLSYAELANTWKQLTINKLTDNTTYTFKYFCVNIKGTFSDGKIVTFTTPQSIYSIVKVSMSFNSPLKYVNSNDFACAIAQSLLIPYTEVASSVNSNCKTNPLIFYSSYNDLTWNYLRVENGIQKFYYNFYIKSTTLSAFSIISTVRDLLRNNLRILKSQIPLWWSIKIEQISPDVIIPVFSGDTSIQVSQNVIRMKYPITNQMSYVLVGLLENYFDTSKMSMPQTYMIKQGRFSPIQNFDQIYMNYTTSNITFQFTNLTANTQYSIFYFVTVDDPSINSRHSEVYYVNLMTSPYLTVDLFSQTLFSKYFILISMIILASITL